MPIASSFIEAILIVYLFDDLFLRIEAIQIHDHN